MKRIPNMYSCMYVFLHMCVAVPACQYMPVCSISHYSYESCRFGAGAGGGPCTDILVLVPASLYK